ncbi:MAG: LytR C-terminal domain-containing protein [Nocardioides sp.]
MTIDSRVRSTLTLLVLLAIVGFGARWGWSSLTKPLPGQAAQPSDCRSIPVAAGEKLRAEDVVVSVFNAGERSGLAESTLGSLADAGFGTGDIGDAPKNTGVEFAEIWSDDPDDPAVALVASWLGQVDIVEGSKLGPGVVVLVGDRFTKLAKGRATVTAKSAATVCAPPEADETDATDL